MSPLHYRIAGYLLTGLILALMLVGFIRNQEKLHQQAASAELAERTDQVVTETVDDIEYLTDDAAIDVAHVSAGRQAFNNSYKEVLRNDPIARTWDASPVPQQLRDQARERRLARERSGCSGDGCGDNGPVTGTSR